MSFKNAQQFLIFNQVHFYALIMEMSHFLSLTKSGIIEIFTKKENANTNCLLAAFLAAKNSHL